MVDEVSSSGKPTGPSEKAEYIGIAFLSTAIVAILVSVAFLIYYFADNSAAGHRIDDLHRDCGENLECLDSDQ